MLVIHQAILIPTIKSNLLFDCYKCPRRMQVVGACNAKLFLKIENMMLLGIAHVVVDVLCILIRVILGRLFG